jgi:hypothetical protein
METRRKTRESYNFSDGLVSHTVWCIPMQPIDIEIHAYIAVRLCKDIALARSLQRVWRRDVTIEVGEWI